jgi:zinc/manganese transport system substrate-binding protein
MRRAACSLLLLAVLAAAGCGGSSSASDSGAVTVVATTTQLGDIVRRIAGDAADVKQILQPNSDPHQYDPRPSDVLAIAGAKVVFESGNGLDAWIGKVIERSGGHPRVITLSETNLLRVPGETNGPEASRYDAHWWHDPRNVEAAIPAIERALAAADPRRASAYARRAAAYLRQVRALDAEIARCFAAVPASARKLVTDHDAFGYFAARYGIRIVGAVIPSQTTEAQPSAGDVARLVRTIRREHVAAVFPESSVNAKLARAIAAETGARSDLTLYGDTLGPSDSDGATYLAMEAHNADEMVRGFTGGARGCRIAVH